MKGADDPMNGHAPGLGLSWATLATVALAGLLSLTACPGPTGGTRIESQRAVRPGWIPKPNRSHPDVLYVTGGCRDRRSQADARACALADAERQIQQRLGAQRPVEIKGGYVEDEHIERRTTAQGEVRDVWVLIAYPRRALTQAETRIADRVLFGVRCDADPPEGCDPQVAARLESAMARAGLAAAPRRLPAERVGQLDEALSQAASERAARLLLATLRGRFLSSSDGEFFAEARCDYRLIDALSGKVQRSFSSGPVKGGHIDKPRAVRKALDNCAAQMERRLTETR